MNESQRMRRGSEEPATRDVEPAGEVDMPNEPYLASETETEGENRGEERPGTEPAGDATGAPNTEGASPGPIEGLPGPGIEKPMPDIYGLAGYADAGTDTDAADTGVDTDTETSAGDEMGAEGGTNAEMGETQPAAMDGEVEAGGGMSKGDLDSTSASEPLLEADVDVAPAEPIVADPLLIVGSDDEVTTGALAPGQIPGQTAPLPQPVEQEELHALPINFVIENKYVVQSLLHHGPDRNLYRVTTRKQQKCPTCGRISSADLEACPHCGAKMAGMPPADFYLMAESHRPDSLMQDPGMMSLNLYHPSLVPVIDFFNQKPFGHTRYYAVAEPRQGVRLSQLSLPRPGGQVLNWAMQLSDALDYLHSQGVVGAGAEADDILVQGDRASLASLQNARANVSSPDELTEQQSLDLARLANTMYEAYTGHPAAMSPEGILPMPSSAPEQVGAAFRAAIEPVQGIAPPIGAARWRDQLAAALEAVAELERPGRPVGFVATGLTNVGRLRELNEDSFGMVEFVQGSMEHPVRMGLYIIADGLGGYEGGEVASAIGVQAFCGELMSRIMSSLVTASGDRGLPNNEAILQGMVRAVQSANERIYKARDQRRGDMSTTVVAALIAGGKAYIVNVGDSRIYMLSRPRHNGDQPGTRMAPILKGTSPLSGTAPLPGPGALHTQTATAVEEPPSDRSDYVLNQVSVDHSLVQRLVELGQLDAEEAKVHPHRNFIYRSLGGPPPIEVDTFVRALTPGDRLLLCSDGLNSMIEDTEIQDTLANVADSQQAATQLIELANEAGGHDNITTIVIDVTEYLPLAEHPSALNNT